MQVLDAHHLLNVVEFFELFLLVPVHEQLPVSNDALYQVFGF